MGKVVALRDDDDVVPAVAQPENGVIRLGGRTGMERRVATRHASNVRAIDTKAEETDRAIMHMGALGARYVDVQRRITNFGNDVAEGQERQDDHEYLHGVAHRAREIVDTENQRALRLAGKEMREVLDRPAIEEDARPLWQQLLWDPEE